MCTAKGVKKSCDRDLNQLASMINLPFKVKVLFKCSDLTLFTAACSDPLENNKNHWERKLSSTLLMFILRHYVDFTLPHPSGFTFSTLQNN